jgi:hypothetical protein
MKNRIFCFVVFLLCSIHLQAQVKFEAGSFINENGQNIHCLIKNLDWISNPTEFSYKLTEDGQVESASIETVKQFEIFGIVKFVKQSVNMDVSTDELHLLIEDRNPVFQKKTLFLKVLVEGKASLFYYQDGNRMRLFYQMENEPVEQLIYKRYLMGSKIAQNNYYKQQIFKSFTCESIGSKEIERLGYYSKDMEKLFVKYNMCVDKDFVYQEKNTSKANINLAIRPGINASSLVIENSLSQWKKVDFGQKQNFRMGIEAELILPFNNSKWALILEPTYQYYKASETFSSSSAPGGLLTANVDFSSIELPFGVRHYFFLNDHSKIFVNLSYLIDITMNKKVDFNFTTINFQMASLDINSNNTLALGAGFKFKDKYSIELRYISSRNLLDRYLSYSSDYQTISCIIGYKLF